LRTSTTVVEELEGIISFLPLSSFVLRERWRIEREGCYEGVGVLWWRFSRNGVNRYYKRTKLHATITITSVGL
jgi:hypothetical protein